MLQGVLEITTPNSFSSANAFKGRIIGHLLTISCFFLIKITEIIEQRSDGFHQKGLMLQVTSPPGRNSLFYL